MRMIKIVFERDSARCFDLACLLLQIKTFLNDMLGQIQANEKKLNWCSYYRMIV